MAGRARNQRPTRAPALAAAGQSRVIESLPPLADRIVAANRALLSGPLSRLFWLKLTVISVFCLGLVMSWRLWIGPRSFPTAPVSDLLPASLYPADLLLFAGLFAASGAIVVAAKPRSANSSSAAARMASRRSALRVARVPGVERRLPARSADSDAGGLVLGFAALAICRIHQYD